MSEPIYPFRWDVSKRSQLGSLLDIPEMERNEWFLREIMNAASGGDWSSVDHSIPLAQWFEREVSLCCAKVLAFCDDSDLYFVGRSPGSIFDYLSGLLSDSSWFDRLTLLHFSAGRANDIGQLLDTFPIEVEQFYPYLAHIQLSPRAIAERPRPTAFVDIVAGGDTFGLLVNLLHVWSKRAYPDWPAVRRKLRIVALTIRTKTSPNAWRWHQHAEWVDLLESGSIKNVSIPSALFQYLGALQSKITRSYFPERWGDPAVREPLHSDPNARMALAQAASLFDKGREKATRRAFVTQMAEQPAMRYPWFRSLAQELTGK